MSDSSSLLIAKLSSDVGCGVCDIILGSKHATFCRQPVAEAVAGHEARDLREWSPTRGER